MSSLAFEPWGSQIGTSMRQGESKAEEQELTEKQSEPVNSDCEMCA